MGERFPKDFEPSPAQREKVGHIRRDKTPEQINEQLKRISRNALSLAFKDGVDNERRETIFKRLGRANSAAQAYNDYHALGAKGNSKG